MSDNYAVNDENRLEQLEDETSVSWEDYVVVLFFESEYYSQNSFSAGSLYALDCASDGYRGSDFGVLDLSIVTLTNFNEEFQSGDTVNAIFGVAQRLDEEVSSIDEYVAQNFDGIQEETLTLRLLEQPDVNPLSAQFIVNYRLRTQELFTDTISVQLTR